MLEPIKGIGVENTIKLNKFKPRSYQLPICHAFENEGYKKLLIVLPRRAGKDIVLFNLCIRAALKRVGLYLYIFPNAIQARRALFEGKTIDGQKMIDFIPSELIHKINIQQMKIELKNESIILFVGSDNYDSLRGLNAVGAVFSEYAYQSPQVLPTVRPMILAADGFMMICSTPFGENHFYTLYEIAKNNPKEWFVYFKTVEDTQHISQEQIREEIERGEISPDKALQEYFCSFSAGALGSYYASYLNRMELNHQIGSIDWEPNFPVHTTFDLGMKDDTVILMWQLIGRQIRIIDMYQNHGVSLEHYINVLKSKEYTWGTHIAPHDIKVRDFTGGGMTRFEKAQQLGINFVIADKLSIYDGIESVRTTLPRIYIDSQRCGKLITALKNYRKEFNEKTESYNEKPVHDKYSHAADALRYLCTSVYKVATNSMSAEELEKQRHEALYGEQLPNFFNHHNRY